MMIEDQRNPHKTGKEPEQNEIDFVDPGRKLWVWVAFVFLIAAMLPVWPISGSLWGIPAWVVFAVFVSAVASAFIAYVVLFVWRDPGEDERERNE